MLEQFHYDSDLIGGSLMVRESRLIADLLLREATCHIQTSMLSPRI